MPAPTRLSRAEREFLEKQARAVRELEVRRERRLHEAPGGLKQFVRYFWSEVEPNREYQEGWAIHAIFDHLEAVSDGRITRLGINVSPGAMKSLSCNVFFPAWQWACRNPHTRFLAFSYSSYLTERDNQRFLDLLMSPKFQRMYGSRVTLRDKGKIKVSNIEKGWKFATSVGGVGTGERADILVIDDAHNLADGESQKIRESTTTWFVEAASNRLNDMTKSAIVVIGQRVHAADIFGVIDEKGFGYEKLVIPMEYDPARHCRTSIGWSDPRTVEGECFFPERFPPEAVEICRKLGSFVWSSQYQQSPEIKEGGLLPRASWVKWEPEGGRFPKFDFVLASLDPAFTSKESNDPSGFTIWGAFKDNGRPSVMLIYAWRKWLKLHGKEASIDMSLLGQPEAIGRTDPEAWGLVEHVADSCRRFKVSRLLIESKASGHSVAQEFYRLFPDEFAVELVDPGTLDKEARAIRVQPILENGQVYYPPRKYAEMVIDECALFPRGELDDLVDSTTQAWYWLRMHGMLQREDEIYRAELEKASKYKQAEPLYPTC